MIGGSKLFHSSIFWSADVASKIVDLVHLTSPANENNQIFRKRLKERFWNGIVVDWKDVESYIEEDDCVLIGPGMTRNEDTTIEDRRLKIGVENRRLKIEKDDLPLSELDRWGREDETENIVNFLLKKYPAKKWVIDGGALQEVDVRLISKSCILTPHQKEFEGLIERVIKRPGLASQGQALSETLKNCTIILKGQIDIVCKGKKCVEVKGGNPGMTKGGTGDVLAGLTAALYAKNDSWTAATMASYINKKAGDSLYKRIGPYFNAEDLVEEAPKVLVKLKRLV